MSKVESQMSTLNLVVRRSGSVFSVKLSKVGTGLVASFLLIRGVEDLGSSPKPPDRYRW